MNVRAGYLRGLRYWGRMVAVSLVGLGDLRFGPPVLAAVSRFFGEFDVEIRFFDPHAERQATFLALARSFFIVMQSKHSLVGCESLGECLEGSRGVCGCEAQHQPPGFMAEVQARLGDRELLWLPDQGWPEPLATEEYVASHQVLRWIWMDDLPGDYLAATDVRAVHRWIECCAHRL